MLLAYYSIFDSMPYLALALAIIVVVCRMLFRSWYVARTILFCFALWLAPAFYLAYMVSSRQFTPALLLGLLTEAIFLGAYLLSFTTLLAAVGSEQCIGISRLKKWLWLVLVAKAAVGLPLL